MLLSVCKCILLAVVFILYIESEQNILHISLKHCVPWTFLHSSSSFLWAHRRLHHIFYFSKWTCTTSHCGYLCDWSILLSVMCSGFIHIVVNDRIPFLLCLCCIPLVREFRLLPQLSIVNNAATDLRVQTSLLHSWFHLHLGRCS